jgi:hypothetical protein
MIELYARLKAFDPKRDQAMRVFVYGHQRFEADIWVPVTEAIGAALRRVHQSYYDELSPLAFEVCTPQEAKARGFKSAPERQEAADKTASPPDASVDSPSTDASASPNPRGRKKDG